LREGGAEQRERERYVQESFHKNYLGKLRGFLFANKTRPLRRAAFRTVPGAKPMPITNNERKRFASLNAKKYRKREGLFLVEGATIALEGMESGAVCEAALATDAFRDASPETLVKLKRANVRVEIVGERELAKIADAKTPQGLVAVFRIPDTPARGADDRLAVALEGVSDPGNLGTILRSCDWFGAPRVALDPACVDPFNPKTLRASAGSIFRVALERDVDLPATLDEYAEAGYEICLADLDGENLFEATLPDRAVLVLGAEAAGVSERLRDKGYRRLTVPRFGAAESLNVAVAASVALSRFAERSRSR
jgi:TrmH family RNA methyltransferase